MSKGPDTKTMEEAVTIELRVGEIKTIGTTKITFVKVVHDIRCPEDVLCAWTGLAIIKLRIESEDQIQESFLGIHGDRGSTIQMAESFDPAKAETTYNNYLEGPLTLTTGKLSVVAISPPRNSKRELQDGEYKVKISLL